MINAELIMIRRLFGHTGAARFQELFAYNGLGFLQYHGIAPSGTTEGDANWFIEEFVYDGSNRVTSIKISSKSANWTNRASETYS